MAEVAVDPKPQRCWYDGEQDYVDELQAWELRQPKYTVHRVKDVKWWDGEQWVDRPVSLTELPDRVPVADQGPRYADRRAKCWFYRGRLVAQAVRVTG